MSANQPIIVVAGGNRGIGFEICRQLSRREVRVILTARSDKAGQVAVHRLADEKLTVQFYPLDVTSEDSILALRDYIERTFGQLDVLINNAGIMAEGDNTGLQVSLTTLRTTLETNTLAPFRLAQVLAPLLKRSRAARIVNMSSGLGSLSDMGSDHAAYRISKTALNAVTGILAAELGGVVAVNCMCPGWVRTDMGGPGAPRDVAQGADTAVWLALDAPQEFTGKLVQDWKVIPW